MKNVRLEKVSKTFDISDDALYSAIGRGMLRSSSKGSKAYIRLDKKAKAAIEQLKAGEDVKKEKIKSLKKQLKLSERIIAAKDEIIKAKDHELASIKEVYNNLLHLYNESKLLEEKNTVPAKETPKKESKPVVEEGYRLISPALFSQRMQEFGFSVEDVKTLIVQSVLEGSMDLVAEGLIIEDEFFSRFERKSTYWDRRNS